MEEIEIMPGNEGRDCPGNGRNKEIECMCDECDFLMCCIPEYSPDGCEGCTYEHCPRIKSKKGDNFPYYLVDLKP